MRGLSRPRPRRCVEPSSQFRGCQPVRLGGREPHGRGPVDFCLLAARLRRAQAAATAAAHHLVTALLGRPLPGPDDHQAVAAPALRHAPWHARRGRDLAITLAGMAASARAGLGECGQSQAGGQKHDGRQARARRSCRASDRGHGDTRPRRHDCTICTMTRRSRRSHRAGVRSRSSIAGDPAVSACVPVA